MTLSTGVRMEYVEQGRSDGLPVVFLHGHRNVFGFRSGSTSTEIIAHGD